MNSIQRSLLVAKELFIHSATHAQHGGELDRMIAIHGFDNAIEILLRAVVSHRDIRIKGGRDGLMGFVEAIGQAPGSIPDRAEIRSLHLARNSVQHSATAPSEIDVARWRSSTHDFLVRATREYFGVDFDTLSPATFIQDDTLRRLIVAASALSQPECSRRWLERAFILAILAFEAPSVPGREEKLLKELLPLIHTSTSPLDLSKYSSLPAGVFHMLDGSVAVHYRSERLTREDVEWLIRFVTRAILDAQEQGLALSLHERARSVCEEFLGDAIALPEG